MKYLKLFFLLFCMSGLLLSPGTSVGQSDPIQLLLQKARSFEDHGRIDLAAKAWQQVLLAVPENPEALSGMARYSDQTGNKSEGRKEWDHFAKANPAASARLAELPHPLDSSQKAQLEEAGRLAATQKPDEAMGLYRAVFGEHPPDGDWAVVYYETLTAVQGQFETAIAHLRQLSKRYPDDNRYALCLGRVLTYRPVTRLEGVRLLQSIAGTVVSVETARKAWRQALLWEKGNKVYENSLHAYLTRYPDPTLEAEFGPVQIPKSPVDIKIGQDERAAYEALRSDNLEEAESLFEKLRSSPSARAKAVAGIGFVRLKQRQFAAAQQFFEEAKSESSSGDKTLDAGLETARFWRLMQEGTNSADREQLDQALVSFQDALKMRPSNVDALRGVAGTLMKSGQAAAAVPVFRRIAQAAPQDPTSWKGLILAMQQAGDTAGVLAAVKSMPGPVRANCLEDSEFLIPLAAAYGAAGQKSESLRVLQEAIRKADAKNSTSTQLEVASMLAQAGYQTQATGIYVRLAGSDPDNVEVWLGLLHALHQANEDTKALEVSTRMPAEVFEKASRKTDFLSLMSSIYESQAQLDSAHRFLEQAYELESAAGRQAPMALQMQVAGLWLKEKEFEKAIAVYRELLEQFPDNVDLWRAELSALQETHRDEAVIELVSEAPEEMRHRLQSDPNVLGLLAASYSAKGESDSALRLIRRAMWSFEVSRKDVPTDLYIQSCWILLDAREYGSLYSALEALAARPNINERQRKSLGDIWAAWSMKKAAAAAAQGNVKQGLMILVSARRAFPQDLKIRGEFAATLLRAGYPKRSLEEFRLWGLLGGSADDYATAVGAAIGSREYRTGDKWVIAGLKQFPDDSQILMAAARLSAAQGKYVLANQFYQNAKAALPDGETETSGKANFSPFRNDSGNQPLRELSHLLAGDEVSNRTGSLIDPPGNSRSKVTDPLDDVLARLTNTPAKNSEKHDLDAPNQRRGDSEPVADFLDKKGKKISKANPEIAIFDDRAGDPATLIHGEVDRSTGNFEPSLGRQSEILESAPADDLAFLADLSHREVHSRSMIVDTISPVVLPTGKTFDAIAENSLEAKGSPTPRTEVETEIANIGAQFSPYVATGAIVSGRAGQPGFDQLVSQETDLEASTTLDHAVRLTVIAKPVFLDAGSPTGQETVPLGTLAKGTLFGPMGVSGLGADFQVATQNFAANFGVTPQGFPVHNLIGDLQFRPGGGPLEFTVSRDPIRDTLLSYAGIKDPGSGQTWGGVIATGISGLGSWGSSESGFYAGFGYQRINGEVVENNSRFDGSVGSYWRVWSQPSGSLTLGLNFSGMSYKNNLRYFTLGQGGYFSPQSYFLFNVPIHWKATYKQLFEYSVDASIGSQHFQEDATPYFPLATSLAPVVDVAAGGVTPAGSRFPPISSPYYPKQISTGANYSLNAKGGYRLTPNWVLGAFLEANNTRSYSSQALGFYVRYQQHPTPLGAKPFNGEIPDWRAMRRLFLP